MPRYAVTFTPVGWQVIDTAESRDPVGEYGLGSAEHARAAQHAWELNTYGPCPMCGASHYGPCGSQR